MTEEQIALARRAVACRGWRWMPGMLTTDGYRLGAADCDGLHPESYRALTDLTDPATLGCLLALVREAWGIVDIGAFRFNGGWCVEVMPEDKQHYAYYGYIEAEALVAALEAAP